MTDTLKHIRLRSAARAAKDALELLVSDPESPDLVLKINAALIALRSALPEAAQ